MSRSDRQSVRKYSRYLPTVHSGKLLLWIEDLCSPLSLSELSKDIIIRINDLHKYHIIRYTCTSKCIRYLKQVRIYERIIIIMVTNKIAETDISQFDKFQQIQSIFIVCVPDSNNTDDVCGKTIKQTYICSNHQSMFVKLKELTNDEQQVHNNSTFNTFNPNGRALRDLRQYLGPFVWSHSYTVLLMSITCDTRDAKRQMLVECRRHPAYYDNEVQLEKISEFERNYHSADAIRWYTRNSFLHSIINQALRTEDPRVLYIYRYYIKDLCKRLEEATLMIRSRQKSSFCVYRGTAIDRDEVEKLRIGTLVGSNGFFSSSLCPDVAKMFIGIDPLTHMSPCQSPVERRQFVLFKIDVDLNQTSDLIVADVSEQSNYPEEKELLFGLGTTFIIKEIEHDIQHNLWHIGMVVSSEMFELKKEYTDFVHKGLKYNDATTLFGIFLGGMSSDYPAGISHLQCHLRKMRFDDSNRANVNFSLGRIYRSMGKYQHAIEYFRRAKLLQKRSDSQSSYVYADTLSELAFTYSHVNDTAQALSLLKQAVTLFCRILGPNHMDMPLYYTRLAYIYWQEKQYEAAHSLLLNALSIFKNDMTSTFAGLGFTKHTMGLVKHALGQREEAIVFHKEALEMRRKLYGVDHPHVAHSYYSMALIYMETGDEQTALEYAQNALNIYQAKLPKNHTDLKLAFELVERIVTFQGKCTCPQSRFDNIHE